MKIIIYSINYYPELIGIGKYNGEMAEWLADKGHEVSVITAPPYYPAWVVKPGYSRFWFKKEKLNQVNVIRCPLWVPSKPSGLKRILHLFSFAFTSFPVIFWYAIRHRPEIIFVVEPPIFCAPATLVLSKLCGARSWLHVQDFEVDAAFDLGILKSVKLRQWISSAETFLMRRFDVVSTISVKMIERLHNKGVDKENTLLFENWVETDSIFPLQERPSLYTELGLPDNRLIILYSGNMGEKQGLEIIIKAAEKLSHREDLLFLMCGAGSSKERLKKLSKGLDNVRFLPLQPLDKLNDLLNLAFIHLLPQQAGVEDLVMPSKLTNMMASGKPVIATVMPGTQVARVLKNCGMIVDPADLESLCAAIEELINDVDKANEMGKAGRSYVQEHWDINSILKEVFTNY